MAFSRSPAPEVRLCTSVPGDLLNPTDLDRAFRGVDRVIHLAAATGKASDADMQRGNVDGTGALIDACTRNGVSRLVHVSTIAVTYPDLSDYPYGRSKRSAEALVLASGLDWTIARPTIVLGPGSPALGPFRTLAAGPALLVPGGGEVAVQPIDVRDVAASLVTLLDADEAKGKIVELGGPERLSMRDLLNRIRERAGKTPGRGVHVPLAMLGAVARVATALLGTRAPLTPGQLTAFRFDSVAADPPTGCVTSSDRAIDAMLGS